MLSTLPALFISHGSPMMALEDSPTSTYLRALTGQFSRPSAIVVISAHWETDVPEITASPTPDTLHDFTGFPPELYAVHYAAAGNPELAHRIHTLLNDTGMTAKLDETRGIDHGVWSPLLLMYPEADIPVVEISVQPHKSALDHYRLGQILAPLRDENILIIGTGNMTHNLREIFRGGHTDVPDWVVAFADWIAEKLEARDIESLLNWQMLAPFAMKNHPTPEHFLPFFGALGAGLGNHSDPSATPIQRLHRDVDMHVLAMDSYAFGGVVTPI